MCTCLWSLMRLPSPRCPWLIAWRSPCWWRDVEVERIQQSPSWIGAWRCSTTPLYIAWRAPNSCSRICSSHTGRLSTRYPDPPPSMWSSYSRRNSHDDPSSTPTHHWRPCRSNIILLTKIPSVWIPYHPSWWGTIIGPCGCQSTPPQCSSRIWGDQMTS